MKVYEIFIKTKDIPLAISNTIFTYDKYEVQHEYDKNTGCVLYGYTMHKDEMIRFREERSNIFIYKTYHITRKEYRSLQLVLPEYELVRLLFKNIKTKAKLMTTSFEASMVDTCWIDFIFPPSSFPYIFPDITKTLKTKYTNALSIIGLNTLIKITDNEYYSFSNYTDIDYDENQPARIHSVEKIEPYYEVSLDIGIKKLNTFINIFGFSFKKKKKKHD